VRTVELAPCVAASGRGWTFGGVNCKTLILGIASLQAEVQRARSRRLDARFSDERESCPVLQLLAVAVGVRKRQRNRTTQEHFK